jgi:ammonium transporter, Amt family
VFAINEYGGTSGLLEGNAAQVVNQLKGVGIVVVYDAVVSLIILWLINAVIGLRVTTDIEREGLDIALHGEAVQ